MSQNQNQPDKVKDKDQFSQTVEDKYKNILKIISWIMSICFISVIVIANFDFYLDQLIVRILYFMGFANLFFFTLLEIFNKYTKKILTSMESRK